MIQSNLIHISILTVILFFSLGTATLAQPTFSAHVDNEKVYRGSFFKIEFQLSNARGSRFGPPTFKQFKVAAGPTRSYQTSIVNGKANSFESYNYTLQALTEGEYTIPSATIVANGLALKTNQLRIVVLPPLQEKDLLSNGAPSGEEYFLVAECNHDTVYVGQQVILDYRIFTKKNIDKIDFQSMPDLSNFHWEGLPLLNEPANQVEISGEQYTTKLLKRYALFPKQSGFFEISPAQLRVMFPKARKRGFFFDNYETRHINSNGVSLEVKSLPEIKPDNFTGLVGSYTMEANSRRAKLTTDDALTVHMRIKGNGDANRMTLKPVSTSPDMEHYDPKIISKNNDQNQKKRNHFAVIEYLYTTSEAGRYFVQPTFAYFDVDSSAFVTLKADSFIFNVKTGSGMSRSESIDTAIVYELVDARASRPYSFWSRNMWATWTWLGLFLASIILSFVKWRQIQQAAKAVIKTKQQRAIEELQNLLKQEDGEIAHRIEEILGNYFRNKFDIIETDWATTVLKSNLREANYDDAAITKILDLFNRCEYAAYGGQGIAQQKAWINEAIDIIKKEAS